MEAYRTETTIDRDGELHLSKLPFREGAAVEVIILPRPLTLTGKAKYPLWGEPLHFERPTDPIADGDWEALR